MIKESGLRVLLDILVQQIVSQQSYGSCERALFFAAI